jgi:hypothetical protein
MFLHDTLIACPSCSCHARSSAAVCPSCGAPLRNADGTRNRTAGAVLLGLALAASPTMVDCGGDVTVGQGSAATGAGGGGTTSTVVSADYGVAPTVGHSASSSSTGGAGGASSSTGMGGFSSADYGLPPTTSSTGGH